jgi:hypothetical protein
MGLLEALNPVAPCKVPGPTVATSEVAYVTRLPPSDGALYGVKP